jgi:hypothetical protein
MEDVLKDDFFMEEYHVSGRGGGRDSRGALPP